LEIGLDIEIEYKISLDEVDWEELKSTLSSDHFDNGRSPAQLEESFRNSYASVVAQIEGKPIGTARVLSDGVCNAYIVDVWTLSDYRHLGIARHMMEILLSQLQGQHVYLFTDDAVGFYQKLGFEPQAIGMGKVEGTWLKKS
jgi:ribosomal protein S18 acetylase RimI-like enzyme